ncbi:MAG: hypothetical protein UR50_C0005G0041 [Parcubacteria group bacterium GW2011_GWC1_34_10]|nr:MAG: hypothetical protein UR50_C0005G0041 [Parcubacteria group bacterium GW2011_GWC1_34_10]OHA86647.1 MAG: hypothetical protein A2726_02200 [Candidatus Zambryskibacteria bacterium RIFCSPHIGHO2_01_FULL_35_32]
MTKKILLIIGILVVVGVALFLIFTSKPQTEGESRVGFSIREFLPFGSSDNTDISINNKDTDTKEDTSIIDTTTSVNSNQPVPKLRKISSEPVAGAVVFNIGTTSVVRFVEKGTGNVYEVKSDSLAVQRLTNTTIPKIIRAYWLPDASGFLAQTLIPDSEIIETNFVKLNKNESVGENMTLFNTTISKLPTGIKEISISPNGSKIFYYTANWSSNWFISNPDGTGSGLVMSHPLTEWLPQWTTVNEIIMQNKGSSENTSYNYIFNISNKTLTKIGLGFKGLSAISNSNNSLTLVSSGQSIPHLFLIDNKDASSKKINANTLAEKCVWTKKESQTVYCAIPIKIPKGKYLDLWYKGIVFTEDIIEKIDLNNDIYYTTSNLSRESGEQIDITDIDISPDETHLIFRNKIDGYLWMLKIGE